ncbi:MAG: DUF4493 domain-containing protein [Rikenellaceae bacterium]
MRRYLYYICAFFVMTVVAGCSKEGSASESSQNIGYATLSLGTDIQDGVSTAQSRAIDGYFEIPSTLIPSAEDLTLILKGDYTDPEDGIEKEYYGEFANIAEFNASDGGEGVTLPAGDYTATLSDGNDIDDEAETNSCFGGEVAFTLVARDNDAEVTIEVTLLNSIISLSTTDYFDNYYTSVELTVTTASGTEITFDPKADGNDDRLFFVKPNTTLTLKGSAIKTNGSEVTFSETLIGTTAPTTRSEIIVDASLVGGLSVTYSLDDSVTQLPEQSFELNPATNN